LQQDPGDGELQEPADNGLRLGEVIHAGLDDSAVGGLQVEGSETWAAFVHPSSIGPAKQMSGPGSLVRFETVIRPPGRGRVEGGDHLETAGRVGVWRPVLLPGRLGSRVISCRALLLARLSRPLAKSERRDQNRLRGELTRTASTRGVTR
jgi:hypothetical protein